MKALSVRPMLNLIRLTYFSAAAVSLFFVVAGLLLLGIGRHLSAVGTLAHTMTGGDCALLKTHWR